MVRIGALLVTFFSFLGTQAQNIESERMTEWSHAGLTMDVQTPENVANILDFGADNTGSYNSNAAYNSAIASLDGHAGTVYFPSGEYQFNSTIVVSDSVFLKGESGETELRFDLGSSGDLIRIAGAISPTQLPLSSHGVKGTTELELLDASSLSVGNVIRLSMFDEDLMFSSWAYGTLGQVVEIIDIQSNILTLADPLNHHYPVPNSSYLPLEIQLHNRDRPHHNQWHDERNYLLSEHVRCC